MTRRARRLKTVRRLENNTYLARHGAALPPTDNDRKDDRFVIRSDKPRVKVSWQVTGIRQDAWAEANRIEVEQWKEPENRGSR